MISTCLLALPMCCRSCSKSLLLLQHFILTTSQEVYAAVIPVVGMEKLVHTEMRQFGQSLRAAEVGR